MVSRDICLEARVLLTVEKFSVESCVGYDSVQNILYRMEGGDDVLVTLSGF